MSSVETTPDPNVNLSTQNMHTETESQSGNQTNKGSAIYKSSSRFMSGEADAQSERQLSHGSPGLGSPLHEEPTPLSRIETDTDKVSDKEDDLNDHHATLTNSVKKMTGRAKRRMYLHHRNRKGLSKQFTPGSAFRHLPWTHHKKSQPEPDIEAQTESEDEGPSLSVWQNIVIMFTTFPYW
jgi:hypothetical protein